MKTMRDEISLEELRDRVIYALFLPTVRLASRFGVPLAQMKELVETAYFQEARRQGLKMREISELMSVSSSKAALLSKQLKENFLSEEQEFELPRRIEFMLWAGPLSLARLNQVLPEVEEEAIEQAIEVLIGEGRIEPQEADRGQVVYGLKIASSRRVWDSWMARLDGLRNALGVVSRAVYGRFFTGQDTSFARSLDFHLLPEDLEALRTFYEEELFPRIVALDEQAQRDEARALAMSLTLFWAAKDELEREPKEPTS